MRPSSGLALLCFLFAFVACGEGADPRNTPEDVADTPATAGTSSPAQPPDAPSKQRSTPPKSQTRTEPPSAPAAVVPPGLPPLCSGLGGTVKSAVRIVKAVGVDLQPAVVPFVLGQGYMTSAVLGGNALPLDRIRNGYVVAVGTPTMSKADDSTRRSGMSYFATSVSMTDFSAIFPPEGAGTASDTTYRDRVNGSDPARGWAALMASSTGMYRALVTGSAVRIGTDSHYAFLENEKQGPDWTRPDVDDFIRQAHYARYFAYSLQIRFDSDCKRDTFLARAGGSMLEDILPAKDDNGLGAFLVDAKAEIVLGVIVLGQAAATQAVLETTRCATDNLPECNALVTKLRALMGSVATAPLPTTFAATATGMSDWFVDSFTHSSKSFLR
jgi:hypothetical protein